MVIKDDDPAKPDAWLIVPTRGHRHRGPAGAAPAGGRLLELRLGCRPRALPGPPQDLGLAINSKAGRSQDLLHIHISCVLPAVRDALAAAPIGPEWAAEPFVELAGHAYNARKVAALEPSPFLLLAELPGARDDMADQSLGVIGSADGGFSC